MSQFENLSTFKVSEDVKQIQKKIVDVEAEIEWINQVNLLITNLRI